MAAENEALKTLLLENLKMHAQTRHAVKILSLRVELMDKTVASLTDLPEPAAALHAKISQEVDQAISDIDERFNAILSAMEKYSNG